ncbi:MAG TPA: hypothetical protein VE033_09845, partial [Acetobacteraceae bacterium]|nr:hypothetical protein [Acetobacteraceae bacterium]
MRGAAALALLLLPGIALAQERVRVRTGDHPGHGRIVADWAAPVPYQVDEAPGRAVLRFGQPAIFDLSGARRLPRNVAGISASDVAVEVTLRPGARLRHYRLGNRVVLDVLDPAPRRAPAAPAQAPAAAPPALPAAAPVPAPPEPSPRLPAVTLLAGSPPALAIPAAAGVGAALLRRGDQWLAVFDAALVLDLLALRGVPALAAAALDTGLDQAVLRVPAAIGPAPRLRREGAAWILDQPEDPAPQRAILAEPEP